MTNLNLKFRILEKFRTQSDFAQAVGCNESRISRVIHGRRELEPELQFEWARVLGCSPEIFKKESVTP